ncbi:hypothetical protein LWI29_032125 [Acer saccharum]|uniref:Uncharacterized protein n=1 Tax=Acer saccharum TaxID=4024 RepID=A0AA39VXU2_ACESA|nr:hypothetical protein LWI29_032125 [Acer saccharum]
MQANTSSDGATATKPLLQEAAAAVSFHGEEDRNRGGGGWWRKVLVLDVEEAKNQVLFSLPMILTNVFYYAIPLVSVVIAGHLGHLELAGATLANSWATVTVFTFMVYLYCRRINSFWVCNPSPSSYLVSIKHQTDQSKEHILCILCYFALHFVLCMVFESVGALKDFLGMRTCGGWRRFLFFLPLVFFLPYLLSVLELHENSIVEGLPKKTRTKSDHLVLGPAAGQGLPNRLQCRGVKALNKTHISTSSHASSVGDSISFVTVFSIYNTSHDIHADGRASNLVTVGNASYSKTERSMAILDIFVNFIQVTMPLSNVIILTDPKSDFAMHRNGITVYPIEGEYLREKLMLQRIRSYITFLERRLDEHSQGQQKINHYIFTDSDIAVVDDLGHIFHNYPNFHLALTFRNNKDQPLNSGFIAVRGTPDGILRAKIFLQEVLRVYSSQYMNASRMLGDQLALAWVVKSKPSFDARKFTKAQAFLEEIGGASVLFLPCATYNWTPPEGAGQFHGMPLDVKVVHFKGSRKRLMLESWNFYSSSSDIFDMLCLILKSGRTNDDGDDTATATPDVQRRRLREREAPVHVAVVAACPPSSLHIRRRRRFTLPSILDLAVVFCCWAAGLGGLLSWLAELDELDEVSTVDWLGCNTQHVLSVAPGAGKFFSFLEP